MSERIGIICGMEESFPAAFIERVNQTPGFKAEFAKLGGINESFVPPYRVLVDRISHEVPYYRIFLKTAALAGTYVINDPFWWSADDKFFGYTLSARLGIRVPRTVLLPQHSYIPAINPQKSLRNLEYPLDWEAIVDYVKFPAILKPAEGGGWKNVSLVHNLNELWAAYNQSNTLPMTLQQFIDFTEYVRCLCIGREFILPIKYDPKRRCYIEADGFLDQALEQKIMDGAFALNNALGYDMNSVEFAIQDGVPYAIDFTNPAPDFDVNSILPRYFHVAVEQMADFVIKCAREGRQNHKGYPFRRFLDKPTARPKGV
jgi:hypothetical protein